MAPNYSKCIIYTIVCNDITIPDFYVGSTTEPTRELQHKNDCNNGNTDAYTFIQKNGGWDNWKFTVIENYSCKNYKQMKNREQYYYDLLNANLNMEPNFSYSVIYKIECIDTKITEIYVGSTTNNIQREEMHKQSCDDVENNHSRVYEFIRANGGWSNWRMVIIENFPCENRDTLREREQYFYEILKPKLNTNQPYIRRPNRTPEEIKQDKLDLRRCILINKFKKR